MLAGEYSINAKLLYGLLLNRTMLSQKSGWVSEDGNVYVIYTIKQMADDLDRSERTVKTALRELGLVAPAETPPAPAEEKRQVDYPRPSGMESGEPHLSANPGQGAGFFPPRRQYLPNGCAGFFPLHGAEIAHK